MQYTVKQLAALSGVTPRTLRHYDAIGLLCPARAQNGYRLYGQAEVACLQQILFYRDAGMELAQIAAVLASDDFDGANAMEKHIQSLCRRRDELDTLIDTAQRTLRAMRGEDEMSDSEKFKGFMKDVVDENEQKYGAEVRERWGDDTADASNAKMMNMTEEKYKEFMALQEELGQALAKVMESGAPAAGEEGQRVADLHKQWLCYTWPQYNAEAHKNLAQMYVDDERFAAYYEQIAPGAATYLRDAVAAFVDGQAQ